MMDLLLTTFYFILTISIVVFIHEFGHFFFARLFKVHVEVFSIGFGKELFGFTDKLGTRWKLSAIPLGGYVKMFGDANPASETDYEKISSMSEEDKNKSFYYKSIWQKAIIVFAGPLANYILTFVIFCGIFFAFGKLTASNEIGTIMKDSPAYNAGLAVGDIITEINNDKVENFDDIRLKIISGVDKEILFKIKRGNEIHSVLIKPEIKEIKDALGGITKQPYIGISPKKITLAKMGITESITTSIKSIINMSHAILEVIWQMITGQRSAEVGGPIKIAQYSKLSADAGVIGYLSMIALLSLNLGLINLFPIPLLDGGHLMFYLIEIITGKPLNKKAQNIFNRVGLFIILSLMSFGILMDIKSLFN